MLKSVKKVLVKLLISPLEREDVLFYFGFYFFFHILKSKNDRLGNFLKMGTLESHRNTKKIFGKRSKRLKKSKGQNNLV